MRVIEELRDGAELPLPGVVAKPALVALMDTRGPARSEYEAEMQWRLDAAVALAEASIAGAERFLRDGQPSTRAGSLAGIGLAVGKECAWRVLRVMMWPWLSRQHRRRRPAV